MTVSELHERHFHALDAERLLLRPLVMEDASDMFAYTSIPESFRFLRRSTHTSEDEDREFIQNVLSGYRQHCEFVWGICFHLENRLIGTCRLFDLRPSEGNCEVSYLVHPFFQKRGIASEAVRRVIRYAFEELDLERVYARCATTNIGSERVMQKCGMILEKTMPNHSKIHGVWHDFLLYSIKRSKTAL